VHLIRDDINLSKREFFFCGCIIMFVCLAGRSGLLLLLSLLLLLMSAFPAVSLPLSLHIEEGHVWKSDGGVQVRVDVPIHSCLLFFLSGVTFTFFCNLRSFLFTHRFFGMSHLDPWLYIILFFSSVFCQFQFPISASSVVVLIFLFFLLFLLLLLLYYPPTTIDDTMIISMFSLFNLCPPTWNE